MKYRFAAFLTILVVVLIVWQAIAWRAVLAQPGAVEIPFAEGFSIYNVPGSVNFFARRADGTYASLEFGVTSSAYSLMTALSGLTQLLSVGLKNLAAAPAGPVGVGTQSQLIAFADLTGNGSGGAAYGVGDTVIVYQAAIGFSLKTLLTTGIVSRPSTTYYSVGMDVNSVFFADFNGDGLPDLAVGYDGGDGPGGIAILLNKGGGAFGNPVTYATGTQATNFAVLDLNHDGVPDIATVSLDQKVTVLLGKGDGTFLTSAQYSVGTGPAGGSGQAIVIADFNGDGNPDIAVGGATGILLGKGDGTFQAGSPLPAVASGTLIWAFAAGDLNGDGKMDLVYADIQNQVVAPLFGNGDGTFQSGQTYAVSQFPTSVLLVDYNNDGRLDIINGRGDARLFFVGGSGNADILVNNGDGTFQGAPAYFTLPNSEAQSNFYSVGAMAAGNFGGTNAGILASATGGLTLFLGNGKGGFQAPQSIANLGGPIAAADFNGDGIADAAVVQQSAGNGAIVLLPGTATGFGSPTPITASGPIPAAMVTGDFSGDGHADLVFVSQANGSGVLGILKGNGNGAFQPLVTSPAGVSPFALSAVDLNGDGKLDLVFADNGTNGVGGGIYVVINMGGGVFQAPVKVSSGSYSAFGVGDVNGDGKQDLVVATEMEATGNGVVSWLAGSGNGTSFQSPIVISTSNAPINAVLVQDFTGTGPAGIVLAHQASNTTYLASYGGGAFSVETPLLGPGEPTLLATADFTGDGKSDLIVGGLSIAVLLNKSVKTAKASVGSAAPAISTSVAPGSLASAYGADLASSVAGSTSLPLPTSFGGTSISIQDASGNVTAAPLLYVKPTQVNFEIPPGLATGPATVTITSGDGTQSAASVQVASVAPGIFELNGAGLAAAYVILYHADGSQTVEQVYTHSGGAVVATPVSLGVSTDKPYLFIFGTGLQDAGTSGVTVTVGGISVPVSYAGAQGGFVGLDQVNAQLPASLAGKGNVTIQVTANGIAANAVNITFQ